MSSHTPVTTIHPVADIAVIVTDSPPVNALAAPVRAGLVEALHAAINDTSVRAIVIACDGRTFHAGADISELAKGALLPTLRDVLETMDQCPKLLVAAMHGTVLGGGLELAMTAHYRIAAGDTRFGLPEVHLGLIPGAGGTQRLPRLVGVQAAIDMITSGRHVGAEEAARLGIVDRTVTAETLRSEAVAWAQSLLAAEAPLRRVSAMTVPEPVETAVATIDRFGLEQQRTFGRLHAPVAALRAVKASLTSPFADGMAREREEFVRLLADPQSQALRHLFFAERMTAKSKWIGGDVQPQPVTSVGVVGAGTMGTGIAMAFLAADLPVRVVEMSADALERGINGIRSHLDGRVSKGKLSAELRDQRLNRLQSSTDLSSLATCDLVIEAIYEDMDAKIGLFRQLDGIVKAEGLLASNTSYLDIEAMARATQRPSQVFGLHFFSPAQVNRLLEIVRTESASPVTLATGIAVAKRIKKLGILVGNAHGFVGNRMLAQRQREADKLILEGALPWQVDRVLESFGLPMGPFRMRDLAGMDIGWNRTASRSATVREILCERGRLGQKTRCGYYDYDDNRRATPSSLVTDIVLNFSAKHGYVRRPIEDQEILERCLYPMINEGARILAEGIAERSSDIDMVWTTGYGWPKWTGGPMHWAETTGLLQIVDRLRHYESIHGVDFTPAPALIDAANSHGVFRSR